MVVKRNGEIVYESDNETKTETGTTYDPLYSTLKSGDYHVTRTVGNVRYDYTVGLYKRGNAHFDTVADGTPSQATLDPRDLVAMKKVIASGDMTEVGVGKYQASDANADGFVNAEDAAFMRMALVEGYDLITTQSGETIYGQGVMPIIGFGGPNQDDSAALCTQDVYNLIADMGINTLVTTASTRNQSQYLNDGLKALQMADKTKIRVFLKDDYVSNLHEDGTKEVTPEIVAQVLGKSGMYGSFAGLFIKDEPTLNESISSPVSEPIGNYASALTHLSHYTNGHSYLNLFPYDSPQLARDLSGQPLNFFKTEATKEEYKEYTDKAKEIGAESLCYDIYYVDNDGGTRKVKEFYTGLYYARELSGNLPFKAFVQAGTDFGTSITTDGRIPTKQEMYLEANAALAMGARGINYFRLVRNEDYTSSRNCLIDRNGNAVTNSDLGENYNYYAGAKRINAYIAEIDHVLMNATSLGVYANGTASNRAGSTFNIEELIGTASKTAAELGLSSITGSDAFVGGFDYYGSDVYLVTNTDVENATTITLTFNGTKTYTTTDMNLNKATATAGSVTLNVPAGESIFVACNR